jgi:hypothetical protein
VHKLIFVFFYKDMFIHHNLEQLYIRRFFVRSVYDAIAAPSDAVPRAPGRVQGSCSPLDFASYSCRNQSVVRRVVPLAKKEEDNPSHGLVSHSSDMHESTSCYYAD